MVKHIGDLPPAPSVVPTEHQILDAAQEAGLLPNTVGHWIPQFIQYHVVLNHMLAAAPLLPVETGEPVATVLTKDPYDERDGVYFSIDDMKKLSTLPAGTRLYAAQLEHSQSSASQIRDAALEEAANAIEKYHERLLHEDSRRRMFELHERQLAQEVRALKSQESTKP